MRGHWNLYGADPAFLKDACMVRPVHAESTEKLAMGLAYFRKPEGWGRLAGSRGAAGAGTPAAGEDGARWTARSRTRS